MTFKQAACLYTTTKILQSRPADPKDPGAVTEVFGPIAAGIILLPIIGVPLLILIGFILSPIIYLIEMLDAETILPVLFILGLCCFVAFGSVFMFRGSAAIVKDINS